MSPSRVLSCGGEVEDVPARVARVLRDRLVEKRRAVLLFGRSVHLDDVVDVLGGHGVLVGPGAGLLHADADTVERHPLNLGHPVDREVLQVPVDQHPRVVLLHLAVFRLADDFIEGETLVRLRLVLDLLERFLIQISRKLQEQLATFGGEILDQQVAPDMRELSGYTGKRGGICRLPPWSA